MTATTTAPVAATPVPTVRQPSDRLRAWATRGPLLPSPDLHDRRDPAPVRGHGGDLLLRLELPLSRRPGVHRLRQLPAGAERRRPAPVGVDHGPADGRGGAGQPDPGPRPGPAPGPEVPGPGPGPHPADRPLPGGARGGGPALEACALQPRIRPVQWVVALCGRPTARLDLQHPAARGRGLPGLAVDPVHDADPAGGTTEPRPAADGSRAGGRRQRLADLPLSDAPAPAPLPRTGRAARLDLHRPELRRGLHDHVRRPGHGQPPLHRLPELLPGPRERPRLGHAASWWSSARSSSRPSRCAWCRRCSARRWGAHECHDHNHDHDHERDRARPSQGSPASAWWPGWPGSSSSFPSPGWR